MVEVLFVVAIGVFSDHDGLMIVGAGMTAGRVRTHCLKLVVVISPILIILAEDH